MLAQPVHLNSKGLFKRDEIFVVMISSGPGEFNLSKKKNAVDLFKVKHIYLGCDFRLFVIHSLPSFLTLKPIFRGKYVGFG